MGLYFVARVAKKLPSEATLACAFSRIVCCYCWARTQNNPRYVNKRRQPSNASEMPSTPRRRQHHSNQGRDIGKPIHNGGEVHLDQICESPVGEVAKRHGIELHSLSTIGMHRKRIVRVTLKQTHIKKTVKENQATRQRS